jgi:hypothetical protein
VAVGVPVASAPPDLARALLQRTLQSPALLCPALLRGHLRAHAGEARAACAADARRAAALLGYCLQDVDERDAASCQELLGVLVLPDDRCAHAFPPAVMTSACSKGS